MGKIKNKKSKGQPGRVKLKNYAHFSMPRDYWNSTNDDVRHLYEAIDSPDAIRTPGDLIPRSSRRL